MSEPWRTRIFHTDHLGSAINPWKGDRQRRLYLHLDMWYTHEQNSPLKARSMAVNRRWEARRVSPCTQGLTFFTLPLPVFSTAGKGCMEGYKWTLSTTGYLMGCLIISDCHARARDGCTSCPLHSDSAGYYWWPTGARGRGRVGEGVAVSLTSA